MRFRNERICLRVTKMRVMIRIPSQDGLHRQENRVRGLGNVVVKAFRYKSEGPGIDSRCHRGIFSVVSDSSMCLGSTQPLKG